MSSLIVLLPPHPASAATEWAYAVPTDGGSLGDHGQSPVARLPAVQGAGAEVVAVVPHQALSWHRVELPKGTSAASPRLRAVLEGLLEEQLLDDPEALHLALAPGARGGAPAWVAACDRAWLRQALQALEAAGHPATRVVPEFAPQTASSLHAVGAGDDAQLIHASESGVLTLPLAPSALALLPRLDDDLPAFAEPAAVAAAEAQLNRKFALEQAPQRWVRAAQSPWDLAQLEFASSTRVRALKRLSAGAAALLRGPAWRPARWALVVLIAAHLLGLNAWAWKERSALAGKRDAVRRTLTDTFPNVKLVVDAPVQMSREIALLRQQTGAPSGRDLESMLAALALAAPAGRNVAAIEFNGSELRARGLGLSPEEVAAIGTTLKGQGYAAVWQGDALVITAEGSP